MMDRQCVEFLQWVLPQLRLRWPGFRKVRGQVHKRLNRRLAELQMDKIEDYRAYILSHATEWAALDALCRISISRFYRDRSVFDALGGGVLPKLASRIEAEEERQWLRSGAASTALDPRFVIPASLTLQIAAAECHGQSFPGKLRHTTRKGRKMLCFSGPLVHFQRSRRGNENTGKTGAE